VAKDGGNLEASRALNVHEKAIGALYETLELVSSGLLLRCGVQQINRHLTISNTEKLVRL